MQLRYLGLFVAAALLLGCLGGGQSGAVVAGSDSAPSPSTSIHSVAAPSDAMFTLPAGSASAAPAASSSAAASSEPVATTTTTSTLKPTPKPTATPSPTPGPKLPDRPAPASNPSNPEYVAACANDENTCSDFFGTLIASGITFVPPDTDQAKKHYYLLFSPTNDLSSYVKILQQKCGSYYPSQNNFAIWGYGNTFESKC